MNEKQFPSSSVVAPPLTMVYRSPGAWWSTFITRSDAVRFSLFATHYHELTQLADSRNAVNNYNIAVREWNDQIIFLRQILPGAADKSYGIQVARPAGLPDSIIDRTKDILSGLKGGEASEEKVSPPSKKKRSRAKVKEEAAEDDHQMTLFG